ncbi:PREDICTED: peptidyl-prolyl cis-trans isomerase FKBP2-like [Rhagoletis zephyria]|uniref:peptidyl-prolyl cis-trans isomerase FKBP2-like n=1 Tax=Rhagoletis zephyria TaxID=28612 RepID=UPI000811A217|nr:PREDICTED: peptidyl-prolyl cis-trans isomerase FKBP2-like [Rhagoletis zephyria]KAH9389970.1 FK506-binding protein 2A [Tyrophagus putrescentiae]
MHTSTRTAAVHLAFFLLLTVCLHQLCHAEEASSEAPAKKKITKLQIGIKKRAENCSVRGSKGDTLHIHYRGTLYDTGAEFDSSYKRGNPLTFKLGAGQVIAGWDQGLLGVCEGEKRKLVIPSDMAYGSAGSPPTIPPDATLVFEVECVKIEGRKGEL